MAVAPRHDGPRLKGVAANTNEYRRIGIRKLTPVIGAEIEGDRFGEAVISRHLRRGGTRSGGEPGHFFRGQSISPEQQLAFGRMFENLKPTRLPPTSRVTAS